MERDRTRFREWCKAEGTMGLYYSCYPLEAPPRFWDDKKQAPRIEDPDAAKARLYRALTAAGFEDVGKTLYPETVQIGRGAMPEPGRGRGGR
jgi:hypothetical protein